MDELLPGEQLIQALEDLRKKLLKSGVQRTAGLYEAMGPECDFYWKSLNVFLKRDYLELLKLVEQAKLKFDECEKNSEVTRDNFTPTGSLEEISMHEEVKAKTVNALRAKATDMEKNAFNYSAPF